MSTPAGTLHGFAYGEHLEATTQRSLGFRLLAPLDNAPWLGEVEALARQFQTAPYPDHWPPCDLFCSVLLADGQRLVALARYGLFDHTANPRRGGLELVGVIGPADLAPPTARSIYEWLKQRRQATEDLDHLGGTVTLADVLDAAPASPPVPGEPTPVLPVRLWREGVLMFASTAPSDPDLRLNLLEQQPSGAWQWLPLVGADFPLSTYADRGPVIAWTPHLSAVAVKLDPHPPQPGGVPPRQSRRSLARWAAVALLAVVAVLTGLNLWQTYALRLQLAQASAAAEPRPEPKATAREQPSADVARFAEAMYDLLLERGGKREWTQADSRLQAAYQQAVRDDRFRDLRLADGSPRGRAAVGAVDLLARRSTDRIEDAVRKALENNKLDPKLIKAVVDTVHEQLVSELNDP